MKLNLVNKYRNLPIQIRASFWFLICAFLQKGISSITTPIFTRLLSTAEYGQFSVFNSWYSIISIIVSLNLWGGVYMQGLVKFDKERKEFASALQGLTFTLTLGWTIIYLSFHDFWNNLFSLTTVQMLAMLIMIWLTSAFSFWTGEQRLELKYKRMVIITLIASVLKPVVGIVFVILADDKVTARILGLALVELVAYLGCFIVQMVRGKKFFSKKFWRYALLFNLPLVPHYLSMSVLSSADRIMIERLVGESEAGIYSLAYSISLFMMLFNQALFQTIEPWLYKKIKANQVEDISKAAYPSFVLIAGVNLLLIAFAPEVIAIFAPANYYDAIWIVPPVAMSVYFTYAYTFFAAFEFYYEKRKYIAIATVIGAVLNIALNYLFIPIFGYYAAGYTTLFCYILFAVCHYYFMHKICKNNLEGRQPYKLSILLTITVAFVTFGIVLLLTYNYMVVRYILVAIILLIIIIKRKLIIQTVKKIMSLKKSE